MALVWVFFLISGFVSRLTLSDNRHSLFPVFLAQYVFITLHRGKKSPQLLSSLVDPEVFFFPFCIHQGNFKVHVYVRNKVPFLSEFIWNFGVWKH